MATYKIKAICLICGGDGLIHNQNSAEGFPSEITCTNCNGTGEIESNLKLDGLWDKILTVEGKSSETADKIDNIIAEQASQRVDLTAILTAIWNKVKNL